MAKKKKGDEDGEKKGGKKKLLPVVLLIVGLLAGKMFFAKPTPKTEAEIKAEEVAHAKEIDKLCTEHNTGEPGGHSTGGEAATEETTGEPATETTEEPAAEETTGEHGDASAFRIETQLVASIDVAGDEVVEVAQGGGGGATPGPEGVGSVLEMDPLTLNLADGHYLKVGIALQLPEGSDAALAKTEGKGALAVDMAIELLSSKTMDELLPATARQELKQSLGNDVCHTYGGTVLTVYFTEFVMQ